MIMTFDGKNRPLAVTHLGKRFVPKPMAPQWYTLRRPIQPLLYRCVRFTHDFQLSRCIQEMNPPQDMCSRATQGIRQSRLR